jgi:phosphoribosylformimino-5-aminoimidazole carboxamide ribotide isomerase
MDLYARVNILGGRAVRLPQGDVAYAISLEADPIERARSWVRKGADRLHIVDLDAAAYGEYRNRELIHELIESVNVPVQIAGGVRSAPEVERLLAAGAWRVVMGTVAIEDQVLLWDLCREHPHKIVVSLDVRRDEELAIRGWTKNSGRYLEEVLIELSSAGVAGFMIHEVGRDALLEPPNYDALRRALSIVDEPVIAAGGVRNLDDLDQLITLEESGKRLAGVVVGREITEGRLTMEQATGRVHAASAPALHLGWCELCLTVRDLGRSRRFYETLGFRVIGGSQDESWLVLTNDDVRIGLYEPTATPFTGPTLSFRGGDVFAVAEQLREQGIAMEEGPEAEPDGSASAVFRDPDGLLIYLNTSPEDTSPA